MSGNGGSKALELLRSLPRVSLANLRPSPGSKKRVSACSFFGWIAGMLSLQRQDSVSAAGTPGLGGGCLEGCQNIFEKAAAGSGEWPRQNRRGKAKEWLATLCVLVLFLSFARLVAGVCGHPHRKLADESP